MSVIALLVMEHPERFSGVFWGKSGVTLKGLMLILVGKPVTTFPSENRLRIMIVMNVEILSTCHCCDHG